MTLNILLVEDETTYGIVAKVLLKKDQEGEEVVVNWVKSIGSAIVQVLNPKNQYSGVVLDSGLPYVAKDDMTILQERGLATHDTVIGKEMFVGQILCTFLAQQRSRQNLPLLLNSSDPAKSADMYSFAVNNCKYPAGRIVQGSKKNDGEAFMRFMTMVRERA